MLLDQWPQQLNRTATTLSHVCVCPEHACLRPAAAFSLNSQPLTTTLQYCKDAPGRVDYKKYLSGWFLGADIGSIKRANVEEFVAYGFCYRTR